MSNLILFESKQIRRVWLNDKWYFSIADVCGALTESPDAGAYWRKLKQRLKEEGSEVVTFCHGLKLEAADGKKIDDRNRLPPMRFKMTAPSLSWL